MKELSTIVEICPLNEPTPFRFLVDNFNIEPILEESASGILYNCDKELYTDDAKPTNRFTTPVSSIVILKDTAGNEIRIGTSTIPAKVMIQPYHNRRRINIKCKMLHSPYS